MGIPMIVAIFREPVWSDMFIKGIIPLFALIISWKSVFI